MVVTGILSIGTYHGRETDQSPSQFLSRSIGSAKTGVAEVKYILLFIALYKGKLGLRKLDLAM